MRILVVEDEVLLRVSLADALRECGYDVDEASNGQLALEWMRRHLPDLVLLDLRMPVIDGFQFRAAQREDPLLADVPVILISANGDEKNARSLGAVGVLDKPVRLSELLAIINTFHRVPNGPKKT
jgi:CheY-like chemotaxis protein